jgi:hypothetical protein
MGKKDEIVDYRTWQQAEDVADRLMEQAELMANDHSSAQRLRDEAIFYMLRAILLKLPEKRN